ncbi:MAG: M24 family metallopeptidase [Thermodesulfobacteriota bacterium]
MDKKAYLIIDSSENNSDLFYRTRFLVPDPIIFIEHKGEKILVLNDLELERGKKEAVVDKVVSLSECLNKLPLSRRKRFNSVDILNLIFKERKIVTAVVQKTFPLYYADELRKIGFKLETAKNHFLFPSRLKKTDYEVKKIKKALKITADAMNLAVFIVSESKVKGKYVNFKGDVLTSEFIKQEVNSFLAKKGYTASHTIAAGGVQGSMPHHSGKGALPADWPIVIDIFPKSQSDGYFGDMTRTVVKGNPSKLLLKMYKTVLEGQKLGISMIKHGIKSNNVHEAIIDYFEKSGFKTDNKNGKPQGFIHSTGHGLGLDIHEPPRIGKTDEILEAGNVVTVEPGLYYEDIGGIRIEDVVLVTNNGNINLTRYQKKFIV